jgi:hypothetical protein
MMLLTAAPNTLSANAIKNISMGRPPGIVSPAHYTFGTSDEVVNHVRFQRFRRLPTTQPARLSGRT